MTTSSRHSGRIDPISLSATRFAEIGRSRISGASLVARDEPDRDGEVEQEFEDAAIEGSRIRIDVARSPVNREGKVILRSRFQGRCSGHSSARPPLALYLAARSPKSPKYCLVHWERRLAGNRRPTCWARRRQSATPSACSLNRSGPAPRSTRRRYSSSPL
jgi:hypothetical protein